MLLDYPDLITTKVESFEENAVSVLLQVPILSEEDLSYHNVSFTINPHVHTTIIANNESIVMAMPYNTLYNVTILGTVVVCGFSGALSSAVSLFYGENAFLKIHSKESDDSLGYYCLIGCMRIPFRAHFMC